MRISAKIKSTTIIWIIFILISLISHRAFASNTESLIINNDYNISYNSFYIAELDNTINNPAPEYSYSKNESSTNWHKILGWSTMGMMLVTISSGFIIPEKGHCGLSVATTALAVATCVNGLYEYGGLISFTDGDWRYNTHAIMGILATSGFMASIALVDDKKNAGKKHAAVGMASAAAFSITLGVLYF